MRMNRLNWGILLFSFLFTDNPSFFQAGEKQIAITIWYGKKQTFGQNALTQRWINILGNISPADRVKSCYYQLNKQAPMVFNLGSDLHRLAAPGDFNIDISIDNLDEDQNQIIIYAVDDFGTILSDTTEIKIYRDFKWPIPYTIDFSKVQKLQEVVQIVDGQWKLTDSGVRTVRPYYDRVLSIGDTTWSNYEILAHLTIHNWTPSQPGPPTYNVSHFGVAMHWRGHHHDEYQPHRKWFPLGAQGEFLLKEPNDSCQWRILFDGNNKDKSPKYANKQNTIQKNKKIWIRSQVTSAPKGQSIYRFKQWMNEEDEPQGWDITGKEENDYFSGSLCLVPHNSDVTIHKIQIKSVDL